MNLLSILTGLAVWAAVSIVAGFAVGQILGFCAQSDRPVLSDHELKKAA
jgi:hypothetical protein